MFIWDFNAVFTIGMISFLSVVLGFWMFYTFTEGGRYPAAKDAGYFRQCRYCGHVYLDHLSRNPCLCPRCASYHDP